MLKLSFSSFWVDCSVCGEEAPHGKTPQEAGDLAAKAGFIQREHQRLCPKCAAQQSVQRTAVICPHNRDISKYYCVDCGMVPENSRR